MTYPHPSRGYKEIICTAGLTENGEWIRLYPIDYRYLPPFNKFHKYQWIEVELHPKGQKNDNRKESRKPRLKTIKMLGEPLSTENNWMLRRQIINKAPIHSINQLRELYNVDRTSLGIVKPSKVLDLKVEKVEHEWKPEWQAMMKQLHLFEKIKPLSKIPYKFSYIYECEDSIKPHKAMITDWELGVLYLKEVERTGSEETAVANVRNKYLNDICSSRNKTLFFTGTTFPHNSWIVLGVFYPPNAPYQKKLFS